jgi:spore germination cell wall hydrolase CwlJ-like protein
MNSLSISMSRSPRLSFRDSRLLRLLSLGMLAVFSLAMIAKLVGGMSGAHSVSAPIVTVTAEQRALIALTHAAPIEADAATARALNAALPFDAARLQAAAPFTASFASAPERAAALQCLAQAVYFEAGFEPLAGRRAVAQVVLNRVRHPAFAHSVCGVVYEGHQLPVCQFSFVCDGSLRRAPERAAWAAAQRIAAEALNGHVDVAVGTATHYHADYVYPRWAPRLTKLTGIGAHIFYSWPGGWGQRPAFSARYAGGEAVPAYQPADAKLPVTAEVAPPEAAGPPERRADNDLGGRLDTSKGWTLQIPMPAASGGALAGAVGRQTADTGSAKTLSIADAASNIGTATQ